MANARVVCLAKRLRRRNPKTGERKSLRAIATELATVGYVNLGGLRDGPDSGPVGVLDLGEEVALGGA